MERRQIVSDTAERAVADTWLVILGGIMGVGLILVAAPAVQQWGMFGAAMLGLYAALCGFILFAVNRRLLAREVMTLYLSHRRCPACAYALDHLHQESDGCVICPECGAAWCLPQEPQERFR